MFRENKEGKVMEKRSNQGADNAGATDRVRGKYFAGCEIIKVPIMNLGHGRASACSNRHKQLYDWNHR